MSNALHVPGDAATARMADERYSVGSAADQYIAALTSPIFRNRSSARRFGIVRA
jgi:hypothetical protein